MDAPADWELAMMCAKMHKLPDEIGRQDAATWLRVWRLICITDALQNERGDALGAGQ